MNDVIFMPDGTPLKVSGSAQNVSDGCHTFKDLYKIRCRLFCLIARLVPHMAWRSFAHNDGSEREGQFIAGLRTPKGDISMHMPTEEYWHLLYGIEEKRVAPPYDGSTFSDSMNILESWILDTVIL